jgi:hypothetical protein
LYVFIITALLLGYVFLAILSLLNVAKDLWEKPFSPMPAYWDSEDDQDDDFLEASRPARTAARDILLQREYS